MIQKLSMVTGSPNIKHFIDLKKQPNGNIFFKENEKHFEKFFSMRMSVCLDSWLVQLEEFPEPVDMFENHPYISGYSKPVVDHFEKLANNLSKEYNLSNGSLVLDIGANDGTLLTKFKNNGSCVIGVDPGNITAEYAKKNQILVLNTFWNSKTGEILEEMAVKPDLITATAVFYHVPNLNDFILGLKKVMKRNSVFVSQSVYLLDVIEKLQFDHFYHEHTCIYSVHSLQMLFNLNGMRIIKIEKDPIHGGSIIVHACLENSDYKSNKSNIDSFIENEKKAGLLHFDTYLKFSNRVEKNINDLKNFIKKEKEKGKKIVGLGAPVKGSTLLNYAEIDSNLVECILEVNPHKIGKVVPGVHIPIIDEKDLDYRPDYFLLLTWNFKDHFIKKYKKFIDQGSKILIPNPTFEVYG